MKKPAEKRALRGSGVMPSPGAAVLSGGGHPITGVERAAHAQGERRDIHQFVGGHDFAVFVGLLGLVGPFPLANFWGTGYRKE
jgi:hypothetical protein